MNSMAIKIPLNHSDGHCHKWKGTIIHRRRQGAADLWISRLNCLRVQNTRDRVQPIDYRHHLYLSAVG